TRRGGASASAWPTPGPGPTYAWATEDKGRAWLVKLRVCLPGSWIAPGHLGARRLGSRARGAGAFDWRAVTLECVRLAATLLASATQTRRCAARAGCGRWSAVRTESLRGKRRQAVTRRKVGTRTGPVSLAASQA